MASFRIVRGSTFLPVAGGVLAIALAQRVSAQNPPPPAHIAMVDGIAMLGHDDQLNEAAPQMLFVPGDRIQTTSGRVEILFPDGSALDVDGSSIVEMQSSSILTIKHGRVQLTVSDASNRSTVVGYQLVTRIASARTAAAGEYRLSLFDDTPAAAAEVELTVLRGTATLTSDRGEIWVPAGQRALAVESGPPPVVQALDSTLSDEFQQWSAAERSERTATGESTRYLPPDLQPYAAAFDSYGTWAYQQPEGYVWYPASAPGWRPYYEGYWVSVEPYGWTWVGFDRWAWATHHYGRWGTAGGRWFWKPGSQWAPAWVQWATAAGYVAARNRRLHPGRRVPVALSNAGQVPGSRVSNARLRHRECGFPRGR